MPNRNKIISQALTGLVGAVIALVCVALAALGPLRAQQDAAASGPKPCEDGACTCQDNMKHLGLSLLQYYQDYDEKFPPGDQDSSTSNRTGVGWAGQMESYGVQAEFRCPTDRTKTTKPDYVVSYGFNASLASLSQAALTEPPSTVLAFEVSGTPVLLHQYDEGASKGASIFSSSGDGTDGSLRAGYAASIIPGVTYATGILGKRPTLPSGSQFPSAMGRHYGYANYLMANGQVHYFAPGDVSSGSAAPTPDSPQTGQVSGTAAGTANGQFQATFSPI